MQKAESCFKYGKLVRQKGRASMERAVERRRKQAWFSCFSCKQMCFMLLCIQHFMLGRTKTR